MSPKKKNQSCSQRSAKSAWQRFGEVMAFISRDLAPPYRDPTVVFDKLLSRIKDVMEVDCVSLFLVNPGDVNKLVFTAGVGCSHSQEYLFDISESALTPFVLRKLRPYNLSKDEIDLELHSIRTKGNGSPYSCPSIRGDRLKNVLAVPVKLGQHKLGVLKVENKANTSTNQKFPKTDVVLASRLADLIAILYQQRMSIELWREADFLKQTCPDSKSFLERMERGEELQYAAGIGYVESYGKHVYVLPKKKEDAESLTAYVAMDGHPQNMSELELATGEIPYDRECWKYFASGSFHCTLILPFGKSECQGVLRVDNTLDKRPKFEDSDEAVCSAFIKRYIEPFYESELNGQNLLRNMCGPPIRQDHPGFDRRCADVLRAKGQSEGKITVEDCWRYLGFNSRIAYYRHPSIKEHSRRQANERPRMS
jgi:hypothetical protein